MGFKLRCKTEHKLIVISDNNEFPTFVTTANSETTTVTKLWFTQVAGHADTCSQSTPTEHYDSQG